MIQAAENIPSKPMKPGFSTISRAVWPILLLVGIGMLATGGAIAVVTRLVIERQTEHWIEKSLRTSSATQLLLIEQYCTETKEVAKQIASRILVRDELQRLLLGKGNAQEFTNRALPDIDLALSQSPMVSGIILYDVRGRTLMTLGKYPPTFEPGKNAAIKGPLTVLISGEPVIAIDVPISDESGARLGLESVFFRMTPVFDLFRQDPSAGLGLDRRLAAFVTGTPIWIVPPGRIMSARIAHRIQELEEHPDQSEAIERDEDGVISGIIVPSPVINMYSVLQMGEGVMAKYKARETNSITLVVCSFVASGTLLMFFLLRPMARRMVNQAQRYERAMNTLQRSEEFNYRITSSTPDCIMTLDPQGRILSISKWGLDLLEIDEVAQFLGSDWLALWAGEGKELASAAMRHALENKVHRFQASAATAKNRIKWWDVATAPMLDADGRIETILAVWRDITDERTLQQNMQTSEERLRMVASATNDAIWDWSCGTGEVWWNDGVSVMFGYRREDVGKERVWWSERVHPHDVKRVTHGIEEIFASQATYWRGEYRFRCVDGSYKAVLDRGYVMRDATGKATRMIGAMFDLSDRRKAEELAHRGAVQAMLRADISALLVNSAQERPMLQGCAEVVVRHLNIALTRIWVIDAEGTSLKLEASAGISTRLDGPDAIVPVGSTNIGKIAAERRAQLSNAMAPNHQEQLPEWAIKEGLVAFVGYPLLAGDALVGVIGMFSRQMIEADTFEAFTSVSDLIAQGTRKAALERAIHQQTEELRKANAELEEFTYVASHDIQEPLRTIINYLTLLASRYHGQLDDKANRYLEFSISASKRLQLLIKGLLSYSKVNHKDPVALEKVSSQQLLGDVLGSLQSAIIEKNAVIEFGNLPFIICNPLQLTQVFQNLIENSLKYRGEATPVIAISAKHQDNYWEFIVRDNGIGIEAAYHDRIFDVFQRLHGQDVYQGTGIGLALCRKIVLAHHGKIWVESEPGRGSAFHFTIPV